VTFASPALLAALGLLVPVLVAFLVRRRRRPTLVASTLLFRRAALARAPTRRIRNLRRLASLAMCLGAVAALVFAAARPSRAAPGTTVAFVVDVSASMGAGGRESPLEQARRLLRRALSGAGTRDRFAVVAAGASPARRAGPLPPGPELDRAVASLAAERGGSDHAAAVSLASALVAGLPSARVVLIHDGGEPLGARPNASHHVPLAQRVVSPPRRDNLGVSGFALRTPADARDDQEREAWIALTSSSASTRSARLALHADGRELARRLVQIPASGDAETRVRVRVPASRLTVRVEPADGTPDALAADDEASLRVVSRPRLRAVVPVASCAGACEPPQDEEDGPVAFFVDKALRAAGASDVVWVPLRVPEADLREGDVLVALGTAPEQRVDLPSVWIGTRRGALPVRVQGEVAAGQARLRSVDTSHSLLRGVALDGVRIERAVAIEAPEGARTLVELDGGAVVAAGGSGRGAWAYVGIAPAHSDMVLRVAFPVLVANALQAVTGASDASTADTVPHAESRLRVAAASEDAAPAEPDPRWRLPVSPAAVLAALGAALLALEAWAYRRGWAS
jgi:hypothetical protein